MLPGKTYGVSELLRIVRQRAWLLAAPPLATLLIGLVVSANLPNRYQAETVITVVPQRVPDAYVRSTVTMRTDERLDAIAVEVLSRALLEEMILEFDLYGSERRSLPMDDVVVKMRGDIAVVPERPRQGPRGPEPLHAFRIRYIYRDAQIVADVVQRIADAFVEQNARDRDSLAGATSAFLEDQLADARQRLELQEARLESFRERYGNALPTQLLTNMQGLQNTQLQIQSIVESAARDHDRQLMLDRLIIEVAADPGVAVVVPPSSAGPAAAAVPVVQQLAAARQNLAQLQQRLTADHPDVSRAKRQVSELETRVAAEALTSADAKTPAPALSRDEAARRDRLRDMRLEVESLGRQLQFKNSEERRLRGVAAEYQRRVDAVPGVEAEWVQLSRDYEATKAQYQDLQSKSEQSKVALELEREQIGEQFRVVDPAKPPNTPVSPVRYQITAISLAIGLLLGLGVIAMLEFRDSSFRTEEDVVRALSLPVLTLIPLTPTAAERAIRARRGKMIAGVSSAAVLVGVYLFWTLRLWEFIV